MVQSVHCFDFHWTKLCKLQADWTVNEISTISGANQRVKFSLVNLERIHLALEVRQPLREALLASPEVEACLSRLKLDYAPVPER